MNNDSVPLLYVAKRRRDARRERVARIACILILSAILPALFYIATR